MSALFAAGGWFFGGRALVASLRTRIALERLAAAAPQRMPEARFTALQAGTLARAGVVTRGLGDDTALDARIANVLDVSSTAPEGVRRSASAAALVVDRKWRAAVNVLETAAARQNDAATWSDLAAARYELAVALDDVEGLLSALVAADRSRRIDPRNANALFNRALILGRLGLRTVAADAWRECLDAANDAGLIADARRRLEANEVETWPTARRELERAADVGDAAAVERVVSRFPQDARTYGEVIFLTDWAKAYLAADSREAARQLRITRAAAAVLRARGETLLAEAVAAVDAAAGDEETLRTLAVAQQAYDVGRDAYRDFQYTEAERMFAVAAAGFARGHSAMELVARAYHGFAMLDHGRTLDGVDALARLTRVVRAQPTHRALLGLIQWTSGRSEMLRSRSDDAVASLQESRAIFTALGETVNVGAVDGLLAEAYDRVGRSDLAWRHCVDGLRGAGADGNAYRLQVAIGVGVRMAMDTRSWDVAASLLDVELAVAAEVRQPALNAVALRRQFIVQNERREYELRDAALGRARIAASRAGEESVTQLAEIDQAEAVVSMQSDPRRAVVLLTRVLDAAVATDRRFFVVDLLRNRARAHIAAGNADAAWADFEAGIEELEQQRERIGTADLRTRFFDTAEPLFEDAIAFLVQRGDAAAAFQYADRARGRSLLELDDTAPVPAPSDLLPKLAERLPNSALVEFAVLDRELVVFCIRDGHVAMHRVPVTAHAVRAKVDELRRRIADVGPVDRFHAAAADLYETLFASVADEIAASSSLIIVPDDDLQHVPFGALRHASTRQYLVQSHAISIAPSAALLTSRAAMTQGRRSALLVGHAAGNEDDALPYLRNVEDEIASLRSIYRSSDVLSGGDASIARFTAAAALHDVIHFGGHGVSDEDSLTASLLFARGARDSGRMYMSDIARLRLPRAPLVVLAACGTLRGRASGMEGMPSLARSFLAAGASTVIGTVQDVNDATARRLLTSFHRSIVAGVAPASALRDAQLEAIARGGDEADAKNWAPYVVYTATP
jgi:CHAT domain-containing protein/tetratricopeptide (TPR) repeat protein